MASEIIRKRTAFSVSERSVEANRRNPPPNLQDGVHRAYRLLANIEDTFGGARPS
jgi:hypothetical protein